MCYISHVGTVHCKLPQKMLDTSYPLLFTCGVSDLPVVVWPWCVFVIPTLFLFNLSFMQTRPNKMPFTEEKKGHSTFLGRLCWQLGNTSWIALNWDGGRNHSLSRSIQPVSHQIQFSATTLTIWTIEEMIGPIASQFISGRDQRCPNRKQCFILFLPIFPCTKSYVRPRFDFVQAGKQILWYDGMAYFSIIIPCIIVFADRYRFSLGSKVSA